MTFNHYVMSSLTYDEQKKEILNNKNFLSTLNVETTDVFALPFGTYQDIKYLGTFVNRKVNIVYKKLTFFGGLLNPNNFYHKIN